ncbi:MAG: catalase family peroxidase [Cyanobacteria bacterium REEB67]|nr:catalase family peroxidase [Cyanobacteria bacterium REEB67]
MAPDAESLDGLSHKLLDALDALFGQHPGFRPAHAKGTMCTGTFVPAEKVAELTCAPHVQRASVPVLVRFSNFAGVPTVADNDPASASPRGFAVRFYLAEHEHTDIIGHSENGFPTRTGEEFLEFARALATSKPDTPKPTPIEQFLAAHPKTKHFVEDPKPIPTSFAHESFFGVSAMKFINKDGVERFGRFQILPVAGNEYLKEDQLKDKDANFLFDELPARLAKESVKMRIVVQMAGPGDKTDDATEVWPADREIIEFGLLILTEAVDGNEPEHRKVIFDPIPRVAGIEPSADPLFELRAALYLMSGRRRRNANPEAKH